MADFDPYGTLGLTPAASAAELKSAYRLRVQTAHPDRGGDPEAFILVVRAFGLLSDPETRRIYDETGIVDEEGVRAWRREIAKILVDMFDAAVSTAIATGLDLGEVDFVSQMRSAVETGLAEARVRLRRIERDMAALRRLGARIRRADAERNLFAERIEAQLGGKAEEHALLRRRALMLESGLTELGSYTSETELIAALEAEG